MMAFSIYILTYYFCPAETEVCQGYTVLQYFYKMQYSTVLVLPSLKGKVAKGLSKNKNKNSRKSFFYNFVTKNFTFAEEA